MFSKEEFTKIIICSLFLGFIFSFNEWGYDTFNLAIGLKNLLISLIICLFLLLIKEYIRKIIAKKIGFDFKFDLWYLKLKNKGLSKTPIGILIAIPLIIISQGSFVFASINTYNFKKFQKSDLKRRYRYIRGIEEAIISSTSAITLTIFALIFNVFYLKKAAFIATILAVYSIVPIPTQDGLKMYFGSKSYYILILSFVILSLTLDKVLGLFATLIISIILAFFIMLFSMNKLE